MHCQFSIIQFVPSALWRSSGSLLLFSLPARFEEGVEARKRHHCRSLIHVRSFSEIKHGKKNSDRQCPGGAKVINKKIKIHTHTKGDQDDDDVGRIPSARLSYPIYLSRAMFGGNVPLSRCRFFLRSPLGNNCFVLSIPVPCWGDPVVRSDVTHRHCHSFTC